jgi:hypothetical protein
MLINITMADLLHVLNTIHTPPFIKKRSLWAALFIIFLIIMSLAFLISSSGYSVDDVNKDGEIDWNEVFVRWIWPKGSEWWKYLIGAGFFVWAIDVSYQVYKYDISHTVIHSQQHTHEQHKQHVDAIVDQKSSLIHN